MTKEHSLGVINIKKANRKIDYLYRISIKGLVLNEKGEALVVKETGRDWWDLPGGGMDHGEDFKTALAREMKEEVNLEGNFTYKIIFIDEPAYLKEHDFWQVRLVFEVKSENMTFSAGDDGDEVEFINPSLFKNSSFKEERRIYSYVDTAPEI